MKQEFKIISSLIEKNSKILDVGCGNGSVAIDIASQRPNSDVIGVDIN